MHKARPKLAPVTDVGGLSIADVYPDIPAEVLGSEPLELPPGYAVVAGVLRAPGDHAVTYTPLIPVATIHDLDSNEFHQDVVIIQRGALQRHVLPRTDLTDSRRILRLASLGVDVTSETNRPLIRFLQDFVRHNLLSVRRQTRRLGWRPTDSGGYYVLHRSFPAEERVAFVADTEDAQRFRAACSPRGDVNGWRDLLVAVARYHRVVVTCLAALVPPLREILALPVPSFWLHLVAPTSTGKTMSQRLACSMWADAMGNTPWISHAHATYAGIEALCLRVFGLPVFLEDVHLLREEDRGRLIMGVGNESFKARGGTRQRLQSPWRGVVISSGELPVTHEGSYGGEAARVISLRGAPFGGRGRDIQQFLDGTLSPVLTKHHAVVGPAFVEHLMALNRSGRAGLEARWADHCQRYVSRADGHYVLVRQAPQWATLALAGQVLADILSVEPGEMLAAVNRAFDDSRTDDVPSPARRAHELLVSAVRAERNACWIWDAVGYQKPDSHGRDVGVWNEEEKFVACYRSFAEQTLLRHGFLSPSSVFQSMRDEGLLQGDGKHLTCVLTFGGSRARLIKLPLSSDDDGASEVC